MVIDNAIVVLVEVPQFSPMAKITFILCLFDEYLFFVVVVVFLKKFVGSFLAVVTWEHYS